MCVCMGAMPMTVQEGWRTFRCPFLLLSALFHWVEVSHWTQTSPLFRWDCCAASPSEPSVLAPHRASCRCWGPCPAFYVGAGALNSHLHKNSYPLICIHTPNETKYEFSLFVFFFERCTVYPGWPGTCSVAKGNLKLLILLLFSIQC